MTTSTHHFINTFAYIYILLYNLLDILYRGEFEMSKKVLGIVAEYNPFHNGHKYHIDEAKKQVKPDITICAMSGNFVQRGEPAIFNKFSRAKTAIKNGIDIVIEIPTYFAVSTAENFAYSAISLLKNAGVTHIAFGVESDDINTLNKIADLLINEPEEYKKELKNNLDKGLSFAVSRDNAVAKFIPNKLLKSPNNILAIEYLKAIKYFNVDIIPVPIKRIVGYYDDKIKNDIASATKIRELIKNKGIYETLIPNNSIIPNQPAFFEDFNNEFMYKLKTSTPSLLTELPDVVEGIENRIIASICSNDINDILNKITTKRYTLSRIKRILISLLLDIKLSDLNELKSNGYAEYLRILAISNVGKKHLRYISQTSSIPVITTVKKFLNTATNLQRKMLEKDILASNVYSLISNDEYNMDFKNRL
ncbi:MAG: nucleotidyltransferase [Clostridiales bacterium]|nr:nucleotidyltransferase [Clostridiales bacterium]